MDSSGSLQLQIPSSVCQLGLMVAGRALESDTSVRSQLCPELLGDLRQVTCLWLSLHWVKCG